MTNIVKPRPHSQNWTHSVKIFDARERALAHVKRGQDSFDFLISWIKLKWTNLNFLNIQSPRRSYAQVSCSTVYIVKDITGFNTVRLLCVLKRSWSISNISLPTSSDVGGGSSSETQRGKNTVYLF